MAAGNEAHAVHVETRAELREADAHARFDAAVLALLEHQRATPARLEHVLEADPSFVAAHALRGFCARLRASRDGHALAWAHLHRAESFVDAKHVTVREHSLVTALRAWCEEDPARAIDALERDLVHAPLDVLRLKLAHALRFMLGHQHGMRAALERVLPHAREQDLGYGHMLGMYAFALEESGALDEALHLGHRALEHAPLDVWGAHAIVHVHETRKRPDLGVAWLGSLGARFSSTNNFGAHMQWHRALFHVDAGEHEEALALYDREIVTSHDDYRDMVNASALLHRFAREGCEPGDRWTLLAERALAEQDDHALPFADVHHALVLVRAERRTDASAFLERMRSRPSVGLDAAHASRELAVLLVEGLLGDASSRARARARRHEFHAFGGSHVQRTLLHDLVDDDR